MHNRTPRLGPLETQAFAWVQLKKSHIIHSGDLAGALDLLPKQESKLLGRLCRAKFIIRLMNGLYLFPLQIPPGGQWGPGADWVLSKFMDAIHTSYQVTGFWAFNR